MISPLIVSNKIVKVSQKRCLRSSIESFTGSSLGEQIIHAGQRSIKLDLLHQFFAGLGEVR